MSNSRSGKLPHGDIVQGTNLFQVLDAYLARRSAIGKVESHFLIDDSGRRATRQEAEEWVRESIERGFPLIRYIVVSDDDDHVEFDLAAQSAPDPESRFPYREDNE
jgi:hypothetical protein